MKDTIRWTIDIPLSAQNKKDINKAARLIQQGATVAFPTETVYGLGADATNENAVANIFQAKGRPQDNPLIAHVATKEQLMQLVQDVPDYVGTLIDTFSPGPITYVLPSNGVCAVNVTAGLSTIGVRIPDHPVAYQLLLQADRPIAAPSANLSGKPSPTLAQHVWNDLAGRMDGLLDGGPTGVGVESTVVDCTGTLPMILRPGGVTKEQLEQVIGEVKQDPALQHSKEQPRSPGMKYKHYSPEVPLWLIHGSAEELQQLIIQEQEKGKRIGVLASEQTAAKLNAPIIYSLGSNMSEIAKALYHQLRSFSSEAFDLIICEAFCEEGLGKAVMNRLRKAASEYMDLNK